MKDSRVNSPCKTEKTLKSYTAASCRGNPQTGGKTTVDLKIPVKQQQLKWQLYSLVTKRFIEPLSEINILGY